jgi:hypothetical protein
MLQDEDGDFTVVSDIMKSAGCGVRCAGCGVRGYLLHTPHSLTLYSALLKIVLPYQDNRNIFKILCQDLKRKFFAVFFRFVPVV